MTGVRKDRTEAGQESSKTGMRQARRQAGHVRHGRSEARHVKYDRSETGHVRHGRSDTGHVNMAGVRQDT